MNRASSDPEQHRRADLMPIWTILDATLEGRGTNGSEAELLNLLSDLRKLSHGGTKINHA
ncbi:hypothetical protein [Bradyrhizobium canariense]|uniref:hypothetical protein n=1 Tax=Bradyrhizobium canariense TaxID=255045 RepID=UPI003D9B463F